MYWSSIEGIEGIQGCGQYMAQIEAIFITQLHAVTRDRSNFMVLLAPFLKCINILHNDQINKMKICV